MFRKFMHDGSGATTTEYGVIGALIAVAAIATLTLAGDSIAEVFNNTAGAVEMAARAHHPAESQLLDPVVVLETDLTDLTDSVLPPSPL